MRSEPKPQEFSYHRRPRTHHSSWVCSIFDPGKCKNLSGTVWCPSHLFPFLWIPFSFCSCILYNLSWDLNISPLMMFCIWGLSLLSLSQCSSLLSVGTLLICADFLSPSLWALGLSGTIRMPSLLEWSQLLENIDDDHCKQTSDCEQPLH